jgi:hypothetical protein
MLAWSETMTKIDSHQVKKAIGRWRKILQIEPFWKIEFEVRHSSSEMSEGNQDSMACINVDLRYFVAEIEFNATEIEQNELDATVLHELLHILIEPLACAAGCGLGKKFEEMNSILCESTIERLMPGYLTLYNSVYCQKPNPKKEVKPKKRKKR